MGLILLISGPAGCGKTPIGSGLGKDTSSEVSKIKQFFFFPVIFAA
jgi:cytidylate kinase